MKTFFAIVLAGAISIFALPLQAQTEKKDESVGEKASDAANTAVEKTKEAGRAVAKTTKKAANAVVDAVTPDADANKVNVKVTEDSIDMPKSVEPGKTAFVVKNSGKENHNFEVRGHGIDKKFMLALAPDQTKVLHVDLKTGQYKAICLMTDHEKKKIAVDLTVR
jgi:iron uptake system EfeUOB component EfeO/EfeM